MSFHEPLSYIYCFIIFFSFCCSIWVSHCPVFQITDSVFASCILLLNSSSVCFSSVNLCFSSVTYVWYFLIFYLSLLKLILCSFILLQSSVNIFMTITLTLHQVNYFTSFSFFFFFLGCCLILSFGTYSSISSFYLLSMFVSMHQTRYLSHLFLKEWPCIYEPYYLNLPSFWLSLQLLQTCWAQKHNCPVLPQPGAQRASLTWAANAHRLWRDMPSSLEVECLPVSLGKGPELVQGAEHYWQLRVKM